ncbi:hypothetical protein APHAL10511_004851 [Amanita phalloides]|nr:hypothetical protein APHAL10511_004851 [Amanita phalloides]
MPQQNNVALLTQSHRAIAAKRKARREQIKEIVFDEGARREFLTGFHKRKLERTEAAKNKAQERQKRARQETRNEQRRALRERAKENAAYVERAYGATLSEDEWTGIQESDNNQDHGINHEFEGEEETTTVTIVEDFDLSEMNKVSYDPSRSDIAKETGASETTYKESRKAVRKR